MYSWSLRIQNEFAKKYIKREEGKKKRKNLREIERLRAMADDNGDASVQPFSSSTSFVSELPRERHADGQVGVLQAEHHLDDGALGRHPISKKK